MAIDLASLFLRPSDRWRGSSQDAFAMQAGAPQGVSAPAIPGAPSGGGVVDSISGIFGGVQAPDNETEKWLASQGLDPGMVKVVLGDKRLLQSFLLDRMKGGGASEFDQRAQAAWQYGLDPSTEEGRNYILSGKLPEARGGAAEVGLQPQYGVDANGDPVILQLGKDAVARQTQLPPGVKFSKEPIKIDAGTEWVLLDPISRQPVGTIPKNVAGAAAESAGGKLTGEAAFDLPRVEDNATLMLDVLERMKTHPGRERSTGFIQGALPSLTSDQVDFQSLVEQTQGQAFLQTYQSLKGGGAITEVEGAKAERALSRLGNQRLSDDEYMTAIQEFENVIKLGLQRARRQAKQPAQDSNPGFSRDDVKRLYDEETPARKKRLKYNPETGTLE